MLYPQKEALVWRIFYRHFTKTTIRKTLMWSLERPEF